MTDVYEQHGKALTASWSPGRAVISAPAARHRTHVERNHDGMFYAWCSAGCCMWGSRHYFAGVDAATAGKNHEEDNNE